MLTDGHDAVGAACRAARREQGIKQIDLAAAAGVGQPMLSRFENDSVGDHASTYEEQLCVRVFECRGRWHWRHKMETASGHDQARLDFVRMAHGDGVTSEYMRRVVLDEDLPETWRRAYETEARRMFRESRMTWKEDPR